MQQFNFDIDLVKADKSDEGIFLVGVASTTDKDLQNEILAPTALKSMVDEAEDVPLTNSHKAEVSDIIGRVVEKRLDENNRLVIKAQLDEDDPEAVRIYNKVAKGHKVGFSVGGRILEASSGFAKGASRIVNRVKLDHIMVTRKPVNPNTFAYALHKALEDADLEKAADVSKDQRDDHATYFEDVNGKKVGKFPIFDEKSAESALHLIGHAPADKQDLIRERACKILGDSHPACQNIQKGNAMDNELQKAGAKFSQETVAALQDIHDAGDDNVKAKVKALLGDDAMGKPASEEAGVKDADPSNLADGDADDKGNVGDAIGVVNKSEDNTLDLVKSEISALIRDEIAKALKPVEPKGEAVIEKSEPVDPIAAYLNAAIGQYLGD